MKRAIAIALMFCSLPLLAAPIGKYQHGTVIRMRMGDCTLTHRGFITNFGAPQGQVAVETCPEYTLLADKVVFVIVGKTSNQLVPLAEVMDFRINKNELAVRVDDARHESKFAIKEMILRSQWDLLQKHIEEQLSEQAGEPVNSALTLKTRE
jgi:hypothetical protein